MEHIAVRTYIGRLLGHFNLRDITLGPPLRQRSFARLRSTGG
ncbi:hypothetical protein BSU04_01385 [Caballeronia sordidicola]|uniref:Uncharacterized protein n=1 Tax=Caballeronia sordidicola TaxID=196367 RepID=A0A226XAJ9_CABSO|nr:hypothetical protein BSU04_01385 [Caballeronia sordidicola]